MRYIVFFLLFAVVLSSHADKPIINLTPPPRVYVMAEDPRPDDFPVEIIDAEKCHTVKILDNEVQSMSFTLKNLTDEEVIVKRLVPGCPCISLKDGKPIADLALQPHGTHEVIFSVDAKQLAVGQFARVFLVEIDKQKPAHFALRGEVIPMISFSPAKQLDLGTIIGDLPWSFKVQIASSFPDNTLSLEPPQQNSKLETSLVQTSPKTWDLTISPILPLKLGMIHEIITLPVKGKENYGPVSIMVTGQVHGFGLRMLDNRWQLHYNHLQAGQMINVDSMIKFNYPKRYLSTGNPATSYKHLQLDEPGIFAKINVSEMEHKQRPLDSLETWKAIMSEISMDGVSEGMTASMSPMHDGIKINLGIPSERLIQAKSFTDKKIVVEIKYQNHVIDKIEIIW